MAMRYLLLLLASLLAGCATSPIILSEDGALPPEEGIVLGRVRVVEDGEEQSLSLLGESKFGLVLLPGGSGKALYVPLNDDGAFAWHLPEGRYTVSSFEWRSHGVTKGRIFAGFEVFKDRVNYIGTLNLLLVGSRYMVTVVDDYETAAGGFAERFPHIDRPLATDLMRIEEKR